MGKSDYVACSQPCGLRNCGLLLTCGAPHPSPRSEAALGSRARDRLIPEPDQRRPEPGAPSPATPHRSRASSAVSSSLSLRLAPTSASAAGSPPLAPPTPAGRIPAPSTRRSGRGPGNRSACSLGVKCLLGLVHDFSP